MAAAKHENLCCIIFSLFLVCTMPTEVRETVRIWCYSGLHSTVSILECMKSVRSGYETIYLMNLTSVSICCST